LLLVKGGRGDQKCLTAKLTERKLEKLPELIEARVSVISDHGMVIHGTEVLARGGTKSNVQECPQCWWVFVWTQQGIDAWDHEPRCAARGVDYFHAFTTSAAASRVVGKSMIAQAASFHFGGSLDQSNLGM
jgi:hypothetical protein